MTEQHVIAMEMPRDRSAGFQEVLHDQLERAYRLASAILRDRVEAEDAVQEALAKAWQHWASMRDPERAPAWFQRIVVNECRGRLRRRGRVVFMAELPERPGPDDSDRSGERDALRVALARISPEDRLVLVLRFYADLTIEDIADRTGSRLGTVKSRLHRALKALRAAYDAAERSTAEVSR
jgi:RNA polymerase sigma-70 factor (sigma-E family)